MYVRIFMLVVAIVTVSGCASTVQWKAQARFERLERKVKLQDRRIAEQNREMKLHDRRMKLHDRRIAEQDREMKLQERKIIRLCRFREKELLRQKKRNYRTCDGFWVNPQD